MKKIFVFLIFCVCILGYKDEGFATNLANKVVAGESLEERLVSSWERKDKSIYLADYNIAEEDIMDYYMEALYKHPELYYVVSEIAIYKLPTQSNVFSVVPKYIETEWSDDDWVLEMMDKPLAMLNEDMTVVEKMLFLHDYLCVNVEYADELVKKDEYHSIIGIVTEGKVVCDGYAKAFQYYMNKLEIPCRIIQGDNHAWNEVEIDGKWYMIDVTHDDPTPDEYGRVMHTHFLKSEKEMEDRTWELEGYQPCTSTIYDNAFWNDIQTQMLYRDGRWYYINGNNETDMNLYCYDFAKNALTDKGDVCVALSEKWWLSKAKQSYWIGSYGKIAQYKDKLIYTTPTRIFRCSFDGKDPECIVHETTTEQVIYGMRIAGDQLLYQLAQSPEDEKQEIMISMTRQPLLRGTIINDSASKSSYEVVYSDFLGGTVLYRRNLDRKATTIIVPESIQSEGRNYRVIGIAKKAFVNNEKLSNVIFPSVLIGKMNIPKKRSYLVKRQGGEL